MSVWVFTSVNVCILERKTEISIFVSFNIAVAGTRFFTETYDFMPTFNPSSETNPKSARTMLQELFVRWRLPEEQHQRPVGWTHAFSLGEVAALLVFLKISVRAFRGSCCSVLLGLRHPTKDTLFWFNHSARQRSGGWGSNRYALERWAWLIDI
jgi:hypothetical protein